MQRVQIAHGLAMPFFPMRPMHGPSLRKSTDIQEVMDAIANGDTVQPKLNGDRACLAVHGGQIYFQNRHGKWMEGTCTNKDLFKSLPGTWVFDGELYAKEFHPFEALIARGENFMRADPAVRANEAKLACDVLLKIPYLFDTPKAEWLADWINKQLSPAYDSNPRFEGVVIKRKGTPYTTMTAAAGHSVGWLKRKWV